ncbi:RNA polymerase sigma factor [Mariprofundus sp. KV]|uniref:RNA polymerase sigma factor n=1 Tax=Mariprofundus sp. KV TaxID=2608715 RepID=UPI0015A175C4|nr:RNA polymerase sigma factor [Mariprofundus sp. KV]NWF35141.1 RNA polymerase sigma factor [Mariprofundus sp. KV]
MSNDEELCLNKIRKGGIDREEGISELFELYSLPFKRYFIKHRLSAADADDLVQESFINIVRYCSTFRNECEIRIWLWKIARNCMLTFFRKQKAPHEEIDGYSETIPDPKTCVDPGPTLEDCVKRAFLRFSEQDHERAEMLTLATIQGWTTKELAELLGRSLGATREYISQCRKHFKPFLDVCRDYI